MQNLKKILHLLFVIVGCSGMKITRITDLRKQQLKCMEDLQLLGPDDHCHTPTSPGPCEDGQFIVLDKSQDLFQGYCKPKCSKPDFVRKDGKCKPAFSKQFCRGIGERLFNNVYGEASECECEDGWSRSSDGVCYQENAYGWCEGGEVLRKITEVDKQNNLDMAFENITSEFTDENTIKAFIAQLQSFYREKLVCGKNRCQEEHLWWEDPETGESDCFEISGELYDTETGEPCVIILNKDPELEDYETGEFIGLNKISCQPFFDTFTLVPDFAKPCKKGKVWSKHRSKCVRDFSG